jgi:hypothetical protein
MACLLPALQTKAQLLQAQHARDAAKRDLTAAEQQLQAGRTTRTGLLQQLSVQFQALMQPPAAASSHCCGSSQPYTCHRNSSMSTAPRSPAVAGPEENNNPNLAEHNMIIGDVGYLSAADCLQELLRLTGCSDEQALLLHVQAHVRAAASLQEAAAAAQARLQQGTRDSEALPV